jgi:multicopper oxidase
VGQFAHDKLFFFFDSEWVRIALPIVTPTIVPRTAFQAYVLQQLSGGQTTGRGSSDPNENCLFYQQMFNLYGNAGGTPTAILGCPLGVAGDGCANRQSVSHSSDDHEQVQTVRLDYNINPKDTAWLRFQSDTGLQAAYTDPINPVFNALSSQPLYSFAAGHTHVFSQNLVNYFNPAFSWYESLFGPRNLQKTLSAFPIVLQGSGANAFTPVGGLDNTWVQGRRASRFFINDNLAWSRGAHELRFGTNIRIFRLNDYDFGEGTVPGSIALSPDETFPMRFAKDNAAEEGFNRWTISGVAYPMTQGVVPASFHLKQGRRYRIRMRNASDDIHPVHLHRHSFEMTNLVGKPTAGVMKDVVMVGGYQEVEVDFTADNPGLTLFHCHQQLHMDFGFMTLFDYL